MNSSEKDSFDLLWHSGTYSGVELLLDISIERATFSGADGACLCDGLWLLAVSPHGTHTRRAATCCAYVSLVASGKLMVTSLPQWLQGVFNVIVGIRLVRRVDRLGFHVEQWCRIRFA